MRRFSPSHCRFVFPFVALVAHVAFGAVACGGTPPAPDATASTESADTAACTAVTSCSGITGAPPELIITCPSWTQFIGISPSGTKTALTMAGSYSVEMSDYAGAIEACPVVAVTWGFEVSSTCASFSTYAPPSSWCPAPPPPSPVNGGKGACRGTCI
jgi:hypothetical protein